MFIEIREHWNFANFVSGHFENKNDIECNFQHYQSIPHFKITLHINCYWNKRTLKFCLFCRRPFWKWRSFTRDFFFVRIFYQAYLIYMLSLAEIPLWGQRFWHVHGFHSNSGHLENSKTWMHLLSWGSTFLWSLVKIGSSFSENLVGQVHSEKKKKRNNNNNNNNNNN
jgi:hypothetical protein